MSQKTLNRLQVIYTIRGVMVSWFKPDVEVDVANLDDLDRWDDPALDGYSSGRVIGVYHVNRLGVNLCIRLADIDADALTDEQRDAWPVRARAAGWELGAISWFGDTLVDIRKLARG